MICRLCNRRYAQYGTDPHFHDGEYHKGWAKQKCKKCGGALAMHLNWEDTEFLMCVDCRNCPGLTP